MMDLRWSFLVVSSGKPVAQIEPRLRAEHGVGAGAGAVGLELALFEHEPEEIEVFDRGRDAAKSGDDCR